MSEYICIANFSNTSCPLTGTNRNHLISSHNTSMRNFTDSVQKLPSISQSSKCLSANGHFSLGSLVMYSSFSLPLSILFTNNTCKVLFCQEHLLFYSSAKVSSSSAIAATVDETVDATVITTTIQSIITKNIKKNKNPSGVIILSPCFTYK